jgi:hypothetical protein
MLKSLAPICILGQLLFVAASAGSLSQGVHKIVEAMLAEDNSFHVYSACTKTYDDVSFCFLRARLVIPRSYVSPFEVEFESHNGL